jgi:hypothetical protein
MRTTSNRSKRGTRMSEPTARVALTATLTVGSAVSWLFCANGIAHAVCGGDRPCFTGVHMEDPATLAATWTDTYPVYDYLNVRYSSPGGPEPQAEIGANATDYRIYGVQPGVTYTVKVQGCKRTIELFGDSSKCTPFDATQFTVPAPEPPPPPPPPRKVELPYSNGEVNPYRCPACELAGN